MPNWCQNRLEIDGPNEAIAKIIKACRLQEGEFDLNGIVPMPPELATPCSSNSGRSPTYWRRRPAMAGM